MKSRVVNQKLNSKQGSRVFFTLCARYLLLVGVTGTCLPTFAQPEEGDALSYFIRAEAAQSQARLGESERLYHRALYHDPRLRAAYTALVDIYLSQHRTEVGLELVEKGLSVFPGDEQLWVRKGLLLSKTNRLDESKIAYDRAESLAPENPHIIRRVSGFYRSQGNIEKAESLDLRRKHLEPLPHKQRPFTGTAE